MQEVRTMLKFENVTYTYPGGETVLNGLSFEIRAGECVGLIGANGVGKSTLMKAALGLVSARGTIIVGENGNLSEAGNAVSKALVMNAENLPAIRRMLGYLLQDSDSQMFMPTVLEDMIFGPMNYGMPRAEAEKKADEVLERLGLQYLKTRQNHRMSGGEKRMAAIAVLLAMEPSMLLMDEPSASLDPKNRRKLIRLLKELPGTKLISSHDLDMVLETCERVLILKDGQIVADGPAGEILRNQTLLEENDLELPFCLQIQG